MVSILGIASMPKGYVKWDINKTQLILYHSLRVSHRSFP
jgi:hypothetical protein